MLVAGGATTGASVEGGRKARCDSVGKKQTARFSDSGCQWC